MKFSSENSRDIEKYFHGTWIKLPVDPEAGHCDPDTLVRIEQVTKRSVIGMSDDDTRYVVYLSEDPELAFNVDYILPHKSYFLKDGYAHLLLRVPARQYKRGVCEENTHVYQMSSTGIFSKLPICAALLKGYTKKPFFESIHSFYEKGLYSAPLSPRMAISMDGRIFIDTTRVAQYDRHNNVVHTKHRLFAQNLKDVVGNDVAVQIEMAGPPPKPKKRALSETPVPF